MKWWFLAEDYVDADDRGVETARTLYGPYDDENEAGSHRFRLYVEDAHDWFHTVFSAIPGDKYAKE